MFIASDCEAAYVDAGFGGWYYLQHIGDADGVENGLNIVITVVAAVGDVEAEVYFTIWESEQVKRLKS